MSLPSLALRVIDPAQVYVNEHRGRRYGRRRRPARGGAGLFGPDVGGGSREASAALGRAEHQAALERVLEESGAQLRAAAEELLASGRATVPVGDRVIDARIVRFWRGDSLLEVSAGAGVESLTRIDRDPRRTGADVLVHYLAHVAVDA